MDTESPKRFRGGGRYPGKKPQNSGWLVAGLVGTLRFSPFSFILLRIWSIYSSIRWNFFGWFQVGSFFQGATVNLRNFPVVRWLGLVTHHDHCFGKLWLLGGGFIYFEFSPRNLGKWSNLTSNFFSEGLQPPTRNSLNLTKNLSK